MANTADKKHLIAIILAFAAIYIIWGTTYLGIRVAVETIPPFFMAAVRFLVAGAVTFLILRARGAPWPKKIHWRSAVIIGAFLLVGGNGLVTWSEQEVPSSTAALVVAIMPIWMALFDWLIFRGSRPGKRVTTGLFLGLLGIVLLIGPGQILGTADFSLTALLILMSAPILWSFGSLYSRRAPQPEDIFMATAIEMLAGGLLLLFAGLLSGEAAQLDLAAITAPSLAALLYLTIFGSFVALTAYGWLLKNVDSAKVATYTYVNPVIAVLLGWLVLNETITLTMIVAMAIIITAVILITTKKPAGKLVRDDNHAYGKSAAISPQPIGKAPQPDGLALEHAVIKKADSPGIGR